VLVLLLTLFTLWRTALLLYRRQSAGLFVLVLGFLFAPWALWTPYFYTDTLSMIFPLAALFFYLKARRSEQFWAAALRYALAAALVFCGYKVKGSIFIVLAALLIHLLMSLPWRRALAAAAVLLCVFLVLSGLFTLYIHNNTWYDVTIESQSAQALIDRGADVLCQHADSPSTQTTAEAAGKYSIGYNTDMSAAAPAANLCSVVWDWGPVYQSAVEALPAGETIPTDFSGNLADGMVNVVFNDALIDTLENGQEIKDAVAEAKEAIINGELYPYVVGPFSAETTSSGEEKAIELGDGEQYVEPQSAPQWSWIIDGITVVR